MGKIIAFIAAFLCLNVALLLCACSGEGDGDSILPAQVDVLKIGKADCIVINTGTKIVMIDTGEKENLDDVRDFMRDRGYKKVDTLILTHFDKDHIGGAKEIIEEYGVSTVLESTASSDSEYFHEYHLLLSQLGISPMRLSQDYTFQSDDCAFFVGVPMKKKYEDKKDNNSSLVVKMEHGETRLLFCGDAEEERLAEIIDTCAGEYDFVKLPYHGNYLENYGEFFGKIKMKYAAITDSKKNPADTRTLDLLAEEGVAVLETRNGTVSFFSDGRSVKAEQ